MIGRLYWVRANWQATNHCYIRGRPILTRVAPSNRNSLLQRACLIAEYTQTISSSHTGDGCSRLHNGRSGGRQRAFARDDGRLGREPSHLDNLRCGYVVVSLGGGKVKGRGVGNVNG